MSTPPPPSIRTGTGSAPSSPRRLPTGGMNLLLSPPSSSSSSLSSIVKPPPFSSENLAGMLRIEVIGAKNLPAAVLGSLLKWTPSYSNPYVVITLHRDSFTTTVKEKALNPSWKEMGELRVPLPSEQELLQTVGMVGGVIESVDKQGKKLASDGPTKLTQRRDFQPCHPELHVEVYHRCDQQSTTTTATIPPAVPSAATSTQQPHHPQQRRSADDKLIGRVTVPLLPCLLSSASSHRAWYTLLHDEHQDAGQIQLAMHYDVGGMEPQKGDIVRLTGFGGMEYYGKLLAVNARLEVLETFQDQVFAQCKSIEGWPLSFEFHRNLLYVVRRPSILRDASTQLHGQITRVRHSPLVLRANSVWLSLPETQRRHLLRLYQLALFSGGTAYQLVSQSVQVALAEGVPAGLQACVHGSGEAMNQITTEFLKVYWATTAANNARVERSLCETVRELEGGPLKGRGRIVRAFGPDADDDQETSAMGKSEEEEEKKADDEEEEEEEEEAVSARVVVVDEDVDEREESDEEDDGVEDDAEEHDANPSSGDCPEQLICPITGCPMLDPVVAADGHSYEREAILHWFATSTMSPMTGMHVPTTQVFPNFTLRKLSEEFQQARHQQGSRRTHRRQPQQTQQRRV